MKNKLTIKRIEALKDGAKKCDGNGLWIHRRGNGRSWLYRWHVPVDGKQKQKSLGLGSYPAVTLAKARELANYYAGKRTAGIDPKVARAELQKQAPEVGQKKTQPKRLMKGVGPRNGKEVSEVWLRICEATNQLLTDDLTPAKTEAERTRKVMEICNVAQSSCSRWRSGEHVLTLKHAGALAAATGYCVEWLIRGKGPKRTGQFDSDELIECLSTSEQNKALDLASAEADVEVFCVSEINRFLARWRKTHAIDDLRKARGNIEYLIKMNCESK